MIFERNDLDALEQRFRANLINSLSGFKSANLIGTTNSKSQHNLSIVSSVVHFGANPPLLGFVMRPDTVQRDTLDNILSTEHYTINQVSSRIWQQAHQTAARYPYEVSEFDETGLHPHFINAFSAPFVEESVIKMGMRLVEIIDIKANNTKLVMGEMTLLDVAGDFIKPDGYVDIERAQTVAISGLDSYHKTERLGRLSYAKPDRPVKPLVD